MTSCLHQLSNKPACYRGYLQRPAISLQQLPMQNEYKNIPCNLPLHAALKHKAPDPIVLTVLTAYPNTTTTIRTHVHLGHQPHEKYLSSRSPHSTVLPNIYVHECVVGGNAWAASERQAALQGLPGRAGASANARTPTYSTGQKKSPNQSNSGERANAPIQYSIKNTLRTARNIRTGAWTTTTQGVRR